MTLEKGQLGRVAEPNLGPAGLAPEGAYRLEPRTGFDDGATAVRAVILNAHVPQLVRYRHCCLQLAPWRNARQSERDADIQSADEGSLSASSP